MQLFILIKKNIPHRQTAGIFNNRKWTWNGTIGHLFPVTFMNPFAFGTCFNHLTIPALGGEKFAFLQFKSKLWELVSPTDFGKLQSRILITCRLVTNFPFWEKKISKGLTISSSSAQRDFEARGFSFSSLRTVYAGFNIQNHILTKAWASNTLTKCRVREPKEWFENSHPTDISLSFHLLGEKKKKNHQHFPCAV